VELRDAKTVGIKDHHERGVVHVHTHLNDSGGHQHFGVVGGERSHCLGLQLRILPTVKRGKGDTGKRRFLQEGVDDGGHRGQFPRRAFVREVRIAGFRLARAEVAVVIRTDLGAHHIDLMTGVHFFA
jgi:hypothetical protein